MRVAFDAFGGKLKSLEASARTSLHLSKISRGSRGSPNSEKLGENRIELQIASMSLPPPFLLGLKGVLLRETRRREEIAPALPIEWGL